MSHATHHHSHGGSGRDLPWARRLTLILLITAGLLTAGGMALLWPHDTPEVAATSAGDPPRSLGEVVRVAEQACPEVPEGETGPTEACGTVTVRVTDGSDAGKEVTTDIPAGPGAPDVEPGDDVTLLALENEQGGWTYSIVDFQRSTPLWLLGAVFALAVVAFGRWRGLTALAGLAVTFAVLLFFIVPAILDGRSPVAVAVVGAAAIMLTVLYLTHGFGVTTTIAVAGTLISLTITSALSAAAIAFTKLSGVADDTSSYLNITQGNVNMQGLLLAGIVIGSLGVLDDVTVTQSATVSELAVANPAYGFRRLYAAATRIGRAHIASVINTIVLAYAGASLPLMLLFATGGTPIGELLTGELIAQELVRSAVGTIGLIAAVPITTALAALVAGRGPRSAAAAPGPEQPRPDAPSGRKGRHWAPDDDTRPATPPADDDRWAAFVERDR